MGGDGLRLRYMHSTHRHQCVIYEGSPIVPMRSIAAMTKVQLQSNHRCLYLNRPEMILEMESQLAAIGVPVAKEVERGALVLSADQGHLIDDRFDIDRMLTSLVDTVNQALQDGFAGLWASGDMAYEFGDEKNFAKLKEYEYRLEEIFEAQPAFSGVCQYHADTLPTEVVQWGLRTHRAIFINEHLSETNPFYAPQALFTQQPVAVPVPQLKGMFARCA